MQHIINVVNDRYLEQLSELFEKKTIETELGYVYDAINEDDRCFIEGKVYEVHTKVLKLGALIHLKEIVESDQNNDPILNQINFIKIQIGMILEEIDFLNSYFDIMQVIKEIEKTQFLQATSLDLILKIQSHLKSIYDLKWLCEDNGVYPNPDIDD